jgi:hypothetical protein
VHSAALHSRSAPVGKPVVGVDAPDQRIDLAAKDFHLEESDIGKEAFSIETSFAPRLERQGRPRRDGYRFSSHRQRPRS